MSKEEQAIDEALDATVDTGVAFTGHIPTASEVLIHLRAKGYDVVFVGDAQEQPDFNAVRDAP